MLAMPEQLELGLKDQRSTRATLCGVKNKHEQERCREHCPQGCLRCFDNHPVQDQRFMQGLRELQARESMVLTRETL